jgi:hypothetical protein
MTGLPAVPHRGRHGCDTPHRPEDGCPKAFVEYRENRLLAQETILNMTVEANSVADRDPQAASVLLKMAADLAAQVYIADEKYAAEGEYVYARNAIGELLIALVERCRRNGWQVAA